MTEWWIGGIAKQTTHLAISKFQAPTSDWPLILRYTPALPIGWLRLIAHRIRVGRGGVASGHLPVQSASRTSDPPRSRLARRLTLTPGLLLIRGYFASW